MPAVSQTWSGISTVEYCFAVRGGNLIADGRHRMIHRYCQNVVALDLYALICRYYREADCWVTLGSVQEIGVEITVQQMSGEGIINCRDRVNIDGGIMEIGIHGKRRDVFNMVIMLVGEQDCLEFLLFRER